MKKNIILFLFILISLKSFGQNDNNHFNQTKNTYIKLSLHKKIFNLKLSKKDSSNFKFSNGDTLIHVKNFKKLVKKISKNKNASLIQRSRAYMPLRQYKERYTKLISKKDSLNFKFKDNDTLILISNKNSHKNQQRVSVPYEPKDSLFLEAYKDVVFLKHRSKKNSSKQRMRYWQEDIKIFFTKNVHKKVKKELKKFAKYLAKEVDSLNIKFVNKLEKSNYIIYGLNSEKDYSYEPRLKNKVIDYYINWNGKQQIYDAKLQIDSRVYETDEDLILKSKKTFLKTLGRFYWTYKLPKESYFSLKYYDGKKFTQTDLDILKYHYSYGICKGTGLKIFEEQHKKAKEALKKGGKITFTHIF